MVDLAAMRDAVAKHGVDPSLVNPKCPTDLVVDHSLQIDYSKWLVHGFIFPSSIKPRFLQFCCFTVQSRILPTPVVAAVGLGQLTVSILPDLPPPGPRPGDPSVGPSGVPAAKLPAVTFQPPRVNLEDLSSRSRTRLSSVLSTCNPCLSECHTWLMLTDSLSFHYIISKLLLSSSYMLVVVFCFVFFLSEELKPP